MNSNAVRQRIAYEAARILIDQGGEPDYFGATRKAAERLGIRDSRNFPKSAEVQQELLAQQSLFSKQPRDDTLRRQRLLAAEAMKTFESFTPRLTGPVVDGTADRYSPIRLYLFGASGEEVAMDLMDRRVPWREGEKQLRFANGERLRFPVLKFEAADTPVELVILPRSALSNPPINPLTESPDKGISRSALQGLIEACGN